MSDRNTSRRPGPESLAPIQLERANLDDDVAQLKRGKGWRLTITALVALVAVAGGARLLGRIDATAAYTNAADRLESIDAQQSDAFLRCALPNLQNAQLNSPSELHNAIEIATERFDKAYGRQLGQCEHLLVALQRDLDELQVPPDMERRIEGLRASARDMKEAWAAYRIYLLDPAQPYDYVKATPLIEKIGLTWNAYRVARTDTKTALRARS